MMMLMVVVVEVVNKNSYMFGMAHQKKENDGEDLLGNVYLGQDNGVASKEDIIVICNDKDSNGCRGRVLSSEVSIKSMYYTFIIAISSLVFVISLSYIIYPPRICCCKLHSKKHDSTRIFRSAFLTLVALAGQAVSTFVSVSS
jgi:hypothetical protein